MMKKLPLLVIALLAMLTSCTQVEQDTQQALFDRIAQSEAYAQFTAPGDKLTADAVSSQLDRIAFADYFADKKLTMQQAAALDDPLLDAIPGARAFIANSLAFYAAHDQLVAAFPVYDQLSKTDHATIIGLYNDHTGRAYTHLLPY